jgi:hypothetical protein
MPTVNNRGRLFLGSAFGCEPRRGNGRRNSADRFLGGRASRPSPRVATQGAASDFPVTALCLFAGRVKIVGIHQLAWTIHAQLALVQIPLVPNLQFGAAKHVEEVTRERQGGTFAILSYEE